MFRSFFPDEYLDSAYGIDYEKLYREGYRGLLFDIDNSIDPKTRNSLVQPPVDHLVNFFAQDRILPIEVWLVLMERMEIVLIGARNRLPNTASKVTFPVVGFFVTFDKIKVIRIRAIWIR